MSDTNDDILLPDYRAVEAVLSHFDADRLSFPFTTDVIKAFAEIFREATGHDPEAKLNEAVLVKAVILAFWAGHKSAQAQSEAMALERLVRMD